MDYFENFYRQYKVPGIAQDNDLLAILAYSPSSKYNMNNLRANKGGIPIHVLFNEKETYRYAGIKVAHYIDVEAQNSMKMKIFARRFNLACSYEKNSSDTSFWCLKRRCDDIIRDFKRGTWF